MNKKSCLSDVMLLCVSVIWGGSFVAVKDALNNIPPFCLMAIRFIIAAIILATIFNRRLKKINKNEIISGIIIGIFLFLGYSFQTMGLLYTKVSKQAFLSGTNVIMVPFIAAPLKKKKPDLYSISAAFLTLIGIALLTIQNRFTVNSGDILTLVCAIFFAAHIVSVDYYSKDSDTVILSIIQLGVCGILSFLFTFIFENPPYIITNSSVLPIFYLTIFSTMLAFLLQNSAQKYSNPNHAAIILSLQSVFGTIFSVLLLSEKLNLSMITGCIIIFAAIIFSETKLSFIKGINKLFRFF